MHVAVAHLLEEALLLSSDSRTELIEAILERSAPSVNFIEEHMETVTRRMKNVQDGVSELVPASEAHQRVLASLKLRE